MVLLKNYHIIINKKLYIVINKSKISKIIINYIINYLIKEYDKVFIIFNLYSIAKLKIVIIPLMFVILI